MNQNEDFELIPGEDEWWNVRFLKGPFVETVVRMGNLVVDEEADNVKYDFHLISSPDNDLSEETESLQLAVGDVLSSLMGDALTTIEEESQKQLNKIPKSFKQ